MDNNSREARSQGLRTNMFFLALAGVVAIIYGVINPEQLVLGLVAGVLFIGIGAFFIIRSLRR
ncbi:hypothetical protein ACMT9Y_11195 [Clavibacter tessellarius]|uniref:hypothetical protein n=1 Tax=Clavibacter tessellarius TaxID=31965 RepID=UPI0039EB1978